MLTLTELLIIIHLKNPILNYKKEVRTHQDNKMWKLFDSQYENSKNTGLWCNGYTSYLNKRGYEFSHWIGLSMNDWRHRDKITRINKYSISAKTIGQRVLG